MEAFFIIASIIIWIGNVFACDWLAEQKGRGRWNWAMLAICFGLVATLWLAIAPVKVKDTGIAHREQQYKEAQEIKKMAGK